MRAPLAWILLFISQTGICLAAVILSGYTGSPAKNDWSIEIALCLLLVNAVSCLTEFFTKSLSRFRISLAVRASSILLLMPYLAGHNEIEIIIAGMFLVETAMYEPYPRNLILTSAFFVCVITIRTSLFIKGWESTWSAIFLSQSGFALMGFMIILLSCFFTRYREEIIAVAKERDKLKVMVVDLAKTNLQYQDFAAEATKSGMEEARLRITRDIHDIVGYTLTNNIAMMEAATDMMRRNPLGIPALLKAARENAEEGLQQIRAALYQLRDQRETNPKGIRAITLLCKFFQKATHIEVDLAVGNARHEYSDQIDSAVYHFVQEGLLNAFRHGKAPKVRVSLWETETDLLVTIGDDGVGATVFQEGIGLRGMRERLEALSGDLKVSARSGSFTVNARIPLREG